MDELLWPRPEEIVVVDKDNNEWVVSRRVNSQTTIRLRILHLELDTPEEAICEICEGSEERFREVGRPLFAALEFCPSCSNQAPARHGWPIERREEFIELARVSSMFAVLAKWADALDEQAELEAMWSSSETTAADSPEGDQ